MQATKTGTNRLRALRPWVVEAVSLKPLNVTTWIWQHLKRRQWNRITSRR